jgi:hypothetical protein
VTPAESLLSSIHRVFGVERILTVSLDTTLWMAGFLMLVAVVGLLLYRCIWRTLPFFFVYSVWTLISSVGSFAVRYFFPSAYLTTYLVETCLDSALQFCVLVELAWSVFRPLWASLPRATVWVLGILIAAAGAAIWPFADSSAFAHLRPQWHLLVPLQQTVSILRVLFFLVLVGCSQLLSIGWRDRELQVATGLGFYSLVALVTTVVHSHQVAGVQYRRLDQLLVASYLCSLVYWVISFAQKEPERREFSPQMQRALLAVAGAARGSRIALADSEHAKTRKR